MSKIFVVIGKSASGKDTIFKKLVQTKELNLKTVVIYTTRPIRHGETDGVEYYFVDDDKLKELKEQNKVIEHRAYHTIHGIWNYFTVHDDQIDLNKMNYIMIGTIESFVQIKKYYGEDIVIPIYIDVEDGLRLRRALNREEKQKHPKYAEMCRRFLADEEDFSKENIEKAGIKKVYQNVRMKTCLKKIIKDIKRELEIIYNQ